MKHNAHLYWGRVSLRAWFVASVVFTVSGLANAGNAPVVVRVLGQQQTIGTLDWNVQGCGMRGTFTFAQGWGHLDNFYDFRWLNIVKADTDPNRPTWFNPATNAWEQPNIPYADPPMGGWDYNGDGDNRDNWGQGSQEGADNSPFYEDDLGWVQQGQQGQSFWDFKRWHTEGQDSRFSDDPGTGNGHSIRFQTILSVVLHGQNTYVAGQRTFGKLVGFGWTYQVDNAGACSITDVHGPIDMASKKQAINQALGNTGFGNWTTIQPDDLNLVPEPSAIVVLAVGLATLAGRRRKKQQLTPGQRMR